MADSDVADPGERDGRSTARVALAPVGFLTALPGPVEGVAYWASRRGDSRTTGDDAAIAALRERYARGDVDEEEYAEGERRLQRGGGHGERR